MDVTSLIVAKSDQINSDDLTGGAIRCRIESVSLKPSGEQRLELRLSGRDKVWRPCKTTTRIMAAVWGSDASKWEGECLELYKDPTVTWAGAAVGGIRISAMSGKGFTGSLNATKGKKLTYTVRMFTPAEVAAIGQPVAQQEPEQTPAEALAEFRAAVKDLLTCKVTTKEDVSKLLADGGYQKLDDVPPDMRRAFYDALATPVEEEAPAK